jgi:hypothetical protein
MGRDVLGPHISRSPIMSKIDAVVRSGKVIGKK